MSDIYNDDNTHGIIQVDANNAFNTINRKMFLHNIKVICPEVSTFISNCYQKPARLFVAGGIEILSQEGTTQGDPASMYVYGLGLVPLLMLMLMFAPADPALTSSVVSAIPRCTPSAEETRLPCAFGQRA